MCVGGSWWSGTDTQMQQDRPRTREAQRQAQYGAEAETGRGGRVPETESERPRDGWIKPARASIRIGTWAQTGGVLPGEGQPEDLGVRALLALRAVEHTEHDPRAELCPPAEHGDLNLPSCGGRGGSSREGWEGKARRVLRLIGPWVHTERPYLTKTTPTPNPVCEGAPP